MKYPATTKVQLQNISVDKKEFRDTLTAEGIPKAICDLLVEKYVVEATVLEAIGKHVFLREVKGLIDEEMPSLKKQEVFFGFFGLMKYPATTKVQLQNISDDKKEFRDTLTAEGIPKAICDLLFEKYVATKEFPNADEVYFTLDYLEQEPPTFMFDSYVEDYAYKSMCDSMSDALNSYIQLVPQGMR